MVMLWFEAVPNELQDDVSLHQFDCQRL